MTLSPRSSRAQSNQLRVWVARYAKVQLFSASLLLLLAFSIHAASGNSKKTKGSGIHKIKHVIIIMQENRSFDSYFGTYPGAEGFPMENGLPAVCNPDPKNEGCIKPYHDSQDANGGGPHGAEHSMADIGGGKMDGFVAQAESGRKGCLDTVDPVCTNSSATDVMGYHDGRDIPNYWAYARTFVLQDHMFEPNASWSLPEHLFKVSAWSAYCTEQNNPASCTNELEAPGMPPDFSREHYPGLEAPGTVPPVPGQSTPGPTSPIFCTSIT